MRALLVGAILLAVAGSGRAGSFEISVSATYPASLYYLIDQMADNGPHASTYYLKYWKAQFGLSKEEQAMLEAYARIKRSYSLEIEPHEQEDDGPFLTHTAGADLQDKWPLPYAASASMEEAWSKAGFLLADDDLSQLRRIFDHFDAKFRPRWEKDSRRLQAALAEFRSKGWEGKMSEHLERLSKFLRLDPDAPRRYSISFVWAPGHKYTGGNSHARLIGRFAPVEIEDRGGPEQQLPIVVHEIVHGLFASMDPRVLSRFQAELLAPNYDAGLAAFSGLDEGWATSLGNGLFMETYLPEMAKTRKSWYAEPDVDRYAHAIDPINREFLEAGKTVSDGYAPRLLAALSAGVPHDDARRLDFNFQTFVFVLSSKVGAAEGPIRAAFHPHSVWTYPLEYPDQIDQAKKLLAIHWATPAVVAVSPEDIAKVDIPGLRLSPKERTMLQERASRGPIAYVARSEKGRPYLLLAGASDALAAGAARLKDAVFPVDRPLIPLDREPAK